MRRTIVILSVVLSCGLVSAGLPGCGRVSPSVGGSGGSGEHARRTEPPAPVAVAPFALGRPDLVLLITGRNNGQMEVCNCEGDPMPGGLSRRGGLFLSYRAAFPQTLALDVGDFFYAQPDETRNEFLTRAYALLQYDALAVGDQELAVGAAELRRLAEDSTLPMFATEATLKTLDLPASITKTVGSRRVVLFSATEEDALRYLPQPVRPTVTWREHTLAESLVTVGAEDFVVVVAHGGDALVERVAALGRVNLILRAHTSTSDPQIGLTAGGVPVVKVGGSDFVGALAIQFDGSSPRVAAKNLELRIEPADIRWPADTRIHQIFKAYIDATEQPTSDTEKAE